MDFLQSGDTLTLTYNVEITDSSNGNALDSDAVTITFHGHDDQPSFSQASITGNQLTLEFVDAAIKPDGDASYTNLANAFQIFSSTDPNTPITGAISNLSRGVNNSVELQLNATVLGNAGVAQDDNLYVKYDSSHGDATLSSSADNSTVDSFEFAITFAEERKRLARSPKGMVKPAQPRRLM